MLPKPTVSVTAPQSTPLRTYTKLIAALSPNGPVAQRLEQRTHNPLVVGSNPTGPTTSPRSNPETWVTECTGYIGNNFGPNGFSSGSSTRVSRSKYPKSKSIKLTSQIPS